MSSALVGLQGTQFASVPGRMMSSTFFVFGGFWIKKPEWILALFFALSVLVSCPPVALLSVLSASCVVFGRKVEHPLSSYILGLSRALWPVTSCHALSLFCNKRKREVRSTSELSFLFLTLLYTAKKAFIRNDHSSPDASHLYASMDYSSLTCQCLDYLSAIAMHHTFPCPLNRSLHSYCNIVTNSS